MKQIKEQLLYMWHKFFLWQKALVALVVVLSISLFWFFLSIASTKSAVPLKEIEEESGVIRGGRGFELFDSNTWIKGEKELEVLEMRALKGQLERDLAEFDKIESASVILDLPPPRPLRGTTYQTKASVILHLASETFLRRTELMAISCHLSGAVRGLKPHMIAISDTQGRLYQAISESSEGGFIFPSELLVEEALQSKIDRLLNQVVGQGHFFVSAQVNQEGGVHMALLLDEWAVNQSTIERIKGQIDALCRGYRLEMSAVIETLPFKAASEALDDTDVRTAYNLIALIPVALALGLVPCLLLFRGKRNPKRKGPVVKKEVVVDVRKLAYAMRQENPETVAEMLSYLPKGRAEEILAAFEEEMQHQVLKVLSERKG